jgi:hypothetical protein
MELIETKKNIAHTCERIGYRGIEYQITSLGANSWNWAIFLEKDSKVRVTHNTITCTRDEVESKCKKAIDACLGGNTSLGAS